MQLNFSPAFIYISKMLRITKCRNFTRRPSTLCELLGAKFEPFTRRFPAFVQVDRGLKIKAFDYIIQNEFST